MQIIGFILFALCSFSVMLFCLLFIRNINGWMGIKNFESESNNNQLEVTIIIPVRNEEKNIEHCLRSVLSQTYDQNNIQILIVDDNSTDESINKIEALKKQNKNITLLHSPNEGKKQAITFAIKHATGSLIVTTDADCKHDPEWISTLVSYYIKTGSKMIVGPVCFTNDNNLFKKAQSIEFSGMIGLTAASIYYHEPIMCNGANLAYEKSVFEEVGGFSGIDTNPSGDDVLLMHKIRKQHPLGINFLKSSKAIVKTNAEETLQKMLEQRSRWASKSFDIFYLPTFFQGTIIFSTNILLFLGLVFSLFIPLYLKAIVFLLVIKSIIEFLFVFLSCSFFQKQPYSWLVFALQPFYGIYLLIISVHGFFGTKTWKGRTFK